MFNKNKEGLEAAPKKSNVIKNTIALKRNVYAIILSVIFIVAVLLINVFSIVMAERYPIELDLTADKKHSMTEENINFIKGVEKKVNIYVCLTEEDYMCETNSEDNMCYLAADKYLVDFNSGNVPYYVQTVELMKKYVRYNDNLSLKFLDMKMPESADITDNFDGFDYAKGDILVESISEDANGEETARRAVIAFKDIYTLGNEEMVNQWEPYMMIYGNYALYGRGAGYQISGNNIEKALSAAIYRVISPETPKYLVPTTYYPVVNNTTIIIDEYLKETLTINNYDLDYAEGMISHILTEKNFDEYEGIILAGCERDISPADYEIISKFLDNNGKRGKSLFYFAGIDVKNKMPQLSVLLGDWGIGFKDGILYETSKSYQVITDESGDPTDFLQVSTQNELLKNTYDGAWFIAGNTVPMRNLWPNGKNVTATYVRTTNVLMRTASYGMTTIMPLDKNSKEWKPGEDAEYDAFPTVIMTTDEMSQEDHSVNVSYVVAFASTEYISNEWISQYTIPNDDFVLDVFNTTSGLVENPFNFATKVIEDPRFTTTGDNTLTIKIIFMAVVPIVIFSTGITVWVVRKRK